MYKFVENIPNSYSHVHILSNKLKRKVCILSSYCAYYLTPLTVCDLYVGVFFFGFWFLVLVLVWLGFGFFVSGFFFFVFFFFFFFFFGGGGGGGGERGRVDHTNGKQFIFIII